MNPLQQIANALAGIHAELRLQRQHRDKLNQSPPPVDRTTGRASGPGENPAEPNENGSQQTATEGEHTLTVIHELRPWAFRIESTRPELLTEAADLLAERHDHRCPHTRHDGHRCWAALNHPEPNHLYLIDGQAVLHT